MQRGKNMSFEHGYNEEYESFENKRKNTIDGDAQWLGR